MVIQGAMETWASRKWTPESLKERFGHWSVPVELGFWKEDEGRYGDYRDLYLESITHAGSKEYFMSHQPSKILTILSLLTLSNSLPTVIVVHHWTKRIYANYVKKLCCVVGGCSVFGRIHRHIYVQKRRLILTTAAYWVHGPTSATHSSP